MTSLFVPVVDFPNPYSTFTYTTWH